MEYEANKKAKIQNQSFLFVMNCGIRAYATKRIALQYLDIRIFIYRKTIAQFLYMVASGIVISVVNMHIH